MTDATRYVHSRGREYTAVTCQLDVHHFLALISSMASSSTTELSKELWERFESTPGCDEYFIEQCASLRLSVAGKMSINDFLQALKSAEILISPQAACTTNGSPSFSDPMRSERDT